MTDDEAVISADVEMEIRRAVIDAAETIRPIRSVAEFNSNIGGLQSALIAAAVESYRKRQIKKALSKIKRVEYFASRTPVGVWKKYMGPWHPPTEENIAIAHTVAFSDGTMWDCSNDEKLNATAFPDDIASRFDPADEAHEKWKSDIARETELLSKRQIRRAQKNKALLLKIQRENLVGGVNHDWP